MNRALWRQSITFLAFGVATVAGWSGSGTALAQDLGLGSEGPAVLVIADDSTELQERLRELYRKIGGNPGGLSPQPKSAMAQIEEFWEANGPRLVVDRLGTQLTAVQLQAALLADPGDIEPEVVDRFLVTLTQIVQACKLF